jgi:hypothetical protein
MYGALRAPTSKLDSNCVVLLAQGEAPPPRPGRLDTALGEPIYPAQCAGEFERTNERSSSTTGILGV